MKKILSYQVNREEDDWKLERLLKWGLHLSAREISRAKFRENGICVNGVRQKVTALVHEGDCVEVCLETEEQSSVQLEELAGELEILYEDEDVLVVNKPAGLVCHPVGGHYKDTLANLMQHYFRNKGEHVVIRIVGRLDRETSGLVIAAKNQAAASRLNRQKEQGIFQKEYLALVQGCPEPKCGTIEAMIGPSFLSEAESAKQKGVSKEKREAIKMQVCPDGKYAKTEYEVLDTRDGISLVRLRIATGRTHQIRVHMAWIGYPLLGDILYGGPECGINRAALHAMSLEFQQPFTGKQIRLEAVLPEDFQKYVERKESDSIGHGLKGKS